MKRSSMRAFVFVFACLMGWAICRADELAAVTGLVTDPHGRSVPGVTILITNLSTNVAFRTVTNDQGIYRVPSLPPGIYRMTVDKDGFKSIVKSGIELHVQDVASINFELQIGSVNETVTVEAGGLVINTTDASVGTVIDRNFVQSLPLNGRSFNTLLQLTPGVVIAQQTVAQQGASPGQFSIAGQRTNANNFTVDGVSANFGVSSAIGNSGTGSAAAFSVLGATSSLVSVDALQEFRINTSSSAPEFGRQPGGQVILSTRSGTNDFHGGIFDYFRNTVMDANDWFNNATIDPTTGKGVPRAPEHHNDFGGFLGGPIWKDKTFFFFSYEGARLRLPQTQRIQVPSTDARNSAPPAIAPYFNAYPKPNGPVSPDDTTAQFTGSWSNAATLDAASIRIDHSFNDRFSIFGRYNYAPSALTSRTNSFNNVDTNSVDTQTLTLGANMLLSNRITNTLRGNYSTQTARNSFRLDSFGGAAPLDPKLLIDSLPAATTEGNFIILGAASFNIGQAGRGHTAQLNFVDDLTVTAGTHQLKFGGDYRAIFLDVNFARFSPLVEALSVQSLSSTGMAFIGAGLFLPSRFLAQSFSLYGQDTWRVTSRLALTYGLRWELAPAPSARGTTTLASWTNTNNPAQTALAPAGTPLWSTTYGNFAPRIGVAYGLTPKGDFVLRAGWGLFYDIGAGGAGNLSTNFPNGAFGTFSTGSLPVTDWTPLLPVLSRNPPFPFLTLGFNPNLELPRSYQWNVALEKSFGGKQVLSATYVGQAGRKLLRNEALFQPNPNFQGFFKVTENTARSNYNALQLQYRRPLSSRLQALLNYTWSHSLDNVSDDQPLVISHTVISGASDYASSDFDVRHSFSGAVTYSVPAAAKSGPLFLLTRDWSLDTIIVARAGFPFNLVNQLAGLDGGINGRPDLVPGQPFWIPNAMAGGGKSLNPSAFSVPSTPRQGTEGRNDIPGFGLTQVDLSVGRRFPITERVNLQFRADAFNVTNHPNFTNPLGNFSGPTTPPANLQSTLMLNQGLGGLNPLFQEGGPRSLQLSLRLTF